MAESAASAFLKPVFQLLGSKIVKEFELVWGVKDELDKLSSYLSAIQSVLQDAKEKQIHSYQVRDWMRKLKDVAWDAEDVLDEFATEALRSKLLEENENQTSKWKLVCNSFFPCLGLKSPYEDENQTSKWKQVCNSFFSCLGLRSLYEHENPLALKSLQFRREISHKIKDINEKLKIIAKERKDLHLRDGDGNGGSRLPEVIRKKPETISLVHESDVLGREDDKEKLINLLVSDGSVSKELSVIPIVGMGGLGKTTLAQLIYNDENVKKHFELRGWVCVSDDFDLKRLSKAIIASTSNIPPNSEKLNPFIEEIQKIVSGKKFLLILDDVWNEDRDDWETLKAPLRCGAKGSKIIVTTRSEKVSRIMGTIHDYSLKLLKDEDCWLLLGKWAFPTEGTWDEHQDLAAIGKKIAKKCRGLPLAVKTLGGLLQGTKEETKWNDILRSEIWKLPRGGKDYILAPLRLSYHHLPSHLKQCFLYCSIFPKDYVFDKEKLVKLWMAEGFITSEVGQRAMEDVGSEYFDDLLWRSFFQYDQKDWRGRLVYKMHDLIHDLAESLSEGECFRKEDDKLNHFSEKARYSSCITHKENDPTIFEPYLQCKRLHTLLVSKRAGSFPTNLFQQMKFLHVLDLSSTRITELPDSIGNLKHLRYLDLSYTKVQRLPESVSSLHNLQTLDLYHSFELVELPKDTRNLINLRHLIFREASGIRSTPKGIGGLTCLQTLSRFIVGKENGHEIGQLMKLINLRGGLWISGLENVVNAKEAILKNKEYIEELDLSWQRNRGSVDDAMDPRVAEEVLERLQPHHNLRRLSIKGYNGERFPSWIGDPSFSKLVDVTLWDCTSCQTLPPLWQLPSLRKLKLRGFIVGIMVTKVVFPSLEELSINSFPNLVECRGGIEEEEEEDCFPCLRKLQISECKNLIALPRFLTSVRELSLTECNERILRSPSYFTSLSSLEIRHFKNLKVIPSGFFKNLKALKDLSIFWCEELVSLVEDDEEDYKYLVSLQRMSISELPKLTFLPDGLKNLISLQKLVIESCKRLATLPKEGLPTTLQTLSIYRCPMLAEQCEKESGKYWSKISYIPNLRTVGI